MSLSTEKSKKGLLVILLTLLLIGCGFIGFFSYELVQSQANLTTALQNSQMVNETLAQVHQVAPHVTITLSFTPMPAIKQVVTGTVTYLTGVVTASNLTGILYPAGMIAYFNVSSTATGNATATYQYIRYQSVTLTKGVQIVQIPWGLWPLQVFGTVSNTITITVTARVHIVWSPVTAIMTNQTISCTFTIQIVEG